MAKKTRTSRSEDMLSFVRRQHPRTRESYMKKMAAYLQSHCRTLNSENKIKKLKTLLHRDDNIKLTRPKLTVMRDTLSESASEASGGRGRRRSRARPGPSSRRSHASRRRRRPSGDSRDEPSEKASDKAVSLPSLEPKEPPKGKPLGSDESQDKCGKSRRRRRKSKSSSCCCKKKSSRSSRRRSRSKSKCKKKRSRSRSRRKGACRKKSGYIECAIL